MIKKDNDIKSKVELLIDNIDEFDCEFVTYKTESMKSLLEDMLEYIKNKEQECEELHARTASIIYSLTGGRLSYSTYTLEGCEQAYHDQLEIDVEKATKELQEELKAKEQECEQEKALKETYLTCYKAKHEDITGRLFKYKQTIAEIIRFFEEDEKFARYSGRPIIFVKPALEKIEKILKKNDIEIS